MQSLFSGYFLAWPVGSSHVLLSAWAKYLTKWPEMTMSFESLILGLWRRIGITIQANQAPLSAMSQIGSVMTAASGQQQCLKETQGEGPAALAKDMLMFPSHPVNQSSATWSSFYTLIFSFTWKNKALSLHPPLTYHLLHVMVFWTKKALAHVGSMDTQQWHWIYLAEHSARHNLEVDACRVKGRIKGNIQRRGSLASKKQDSAANSSGSSLQGRPDRQAVGTGKHTD